MSLEIEKLQKSFHQGETELQILKDLQCHISSGEVIAILGESGSGKSTLLSLLAGLDRADAGSIVINGVDTQSLTEEQLTAFRSHNIGIVFQQYHLVDHLTSLENVMLPLEINRVANARSRAEAVLEELSLAHRMSHFPTQLSGGECQRVAIARAIVTEPKILLADEPSGNLDSHTGEKVMGVLFDVVKKHRMTTILVTHSEQLAKLCERRLKLIDGKLQPFAEEN